MKLRELLSQNDRKLRFVEERQAIQAIGCNNAVIAHLQVPANVAGRLAD
jgi:hypothetical protein